MSEEATAVDVELDELETEMNFVLGRSLISFDEMAQGPTADRPPKGVKPEDKKAMKLWGDVLKKYSKNIFKSNEVGKQWAAAVAILKRSAAKRNIKLFADIGDDQWNLFISEQLSGSELDRILSVIV